MRYAIVYTIGLLALITPSCGHSVSTEKMHEFWLSTTLNGHASPRLLRVYSAQARPYSASALLVEQMDWQQLGLRINMPELAFAQARNTDAWLTQAALTQTKVTPEIGIDRPSEAYDKRIYLALSDFADVVAQYDAPRQRLALTLPTQRFQAYTHQLGGQTQALADAAMTSAVLNYDVFAQRHWSAAPDGSEVHASVMAGVRPQHARYQQSRHELAGFIEGRFSNQWGVLQQDALLRSPSMANTAPWRRLETRFSHYDQLSMTSLHLGDSISAGLPSSSAVRVGGIQWRRNFSLRPDLVTQPLPQIKGSSGVPTTVDVYIDQVRRQQIAVPAGDFTITQLPILVGPQRMQVVVRDVLGRDQISTLDLFSSPKLLSPGLLDFALQSGFVRRNFGVEGDRYERSPVAIGSLRYGVLPKLTAQGQLETAAEVSTLRVGGATLLGRIGSMSIDVATSQHAVGWGHEAAAHVDVSPSATRSMSASWLAADARFRDLASREVRAIKQHSRQLLTFSQSLPRASTLSMSLVKQTSFSAALCSLSHYLKGLGSVSLNAYSGLSGARVWGVSLGLSLAFNHRVNANVSQDISHKGSSKRLSAQSATSGMSDWGWRFHASDGQRELQRAEIFVRHRVGALNMQLEHADYGLATRLGMTGALAYLPGSMYASQRVQDAFALLDLGYPGVRVQANNRDVGVTNQQGFLFVNDLLSYHASQLRINPLDLPLAVQAGSSETLVTPRRHAGVHVRFPLHVNHEVLLAIKHSHGAWLNMGARVLLPNDEVRIVGHEGQVLVPAALAGQALEVLSEGHLCYVHLPPALSPSQIVSQLVNVQCA